MIRQINYKHTYKIRHEVMWPDRPLDYIKLDYDPEGIHYGYYLEDQLISVISVFVTDGSAQFRKFATLIPFQHKGYGSKLLKYVMRVLEDIVDEIWCNARFEKTSYYERFGLKLTNEIFEKGGKNYIIMRKKIQR